MTAQESRLHRQRRRAAFLLPSAFTIGNIFLGFFAIVLALRGRFVWAAGCILIAGVVDNLDGRIARMTGTESDFGREFELLSPTWSRSELLRLWWRTCGGLLIRSRNGLAGAARFRCLLRHSAGTVQRPDRTRRQTLFRRPPLPRGGLGIACVLLVVPHSEGRIWLLVAMALALGLLGTLMVSTFRYWSFKSLDFRRPHSYRIALPLAGMLLLLAFYPEAFLPVMALAYAISGPVLWLLNRAGFGRPSPPPAEAGAA